MALTLKKPIAKLSPKEQHISVRILRSKKRAKSRKRTVKYKQKTLF